MSIRYCTQTRSNLECVPSIKPCLGLCAWLQRHTCRRPRTSFKRTEVVSPSLLSKPLVRITTVVFSLFNQEPPNCAAKHVVSYPRYPSDVVCPRRRVHVAFPQRRDRFQDQRKSLTMQPRLNSSWSSSIWERPPRYWNGNSCWPSWLLTIPALPLMLPFSISLIPSEMDRETLRRPSSPPSRTGDVQFYLHLQCPIDRNEVASLSPFPLPQYGDRCIGGGCQSVPVVPGRRPARDTRTLPVFRVKGPNWDLHARTPGTALRDQSCENVYVGAIDPGVVAGAFRPS